MVLGVYPVAESAALDLFAIQRKRDMKVYKYQVFALALMSIQKGLELFQYI